MGKRTRGIFLTVTACLPVTIVLGVLAEAQGQNYWEVASGNWAVSSNWSQGEPGSNMNNANAYAYINSGTATVNSAVPTCYTLTLGNGAAGTSGAVQLMSGGQLSGTGLAIGNLGVGLFTQAGGTNIWTANLNSGGVVVANGSYDLSAGLLTTNNVSVLGLGEASVFMQSGGTDQTGPGSSPEYGTAGMVLDAGGTYNFMNGTLSVAGGELIGYDPDPIVSLFAQSGGTHTVSGGLTIGGTTNLELGPGNETGIGLYTLTSAGLLSTNEETVGLEGSGTFTQSGGTATISGTLLLAASSFGSGTYNLNGGLLTLSGLTQGAGAVVFNFSGGTFRAGASFSTNVPITFSAGGASGVFDTNGHTLTLAGSLSGPGGFQKIGAGTLVTSAFNTFGGDVTVSGGTLQISSGKLPAANEYVGIGGVGYGGNGTVVLSAGTNAVSSNLYLGDGYGLGTGFEGTYLQSGASRLSAPNEYIGYGQVDLGYFTQTGGTNAVSVHLYLADSYLSSGNYNLTNGRLSAPNEDIGYADDAFGVFMQTGGSNVVNSTLTIGTNGDGSYSQSAGLLSSSTEYVGYSGTGGFTQSGGTHTVTNGLYFGYNTGGSGTYTMTAGSLSAPGAEYVGGEYIGYYGTGSFVQSGGTNTVPALLSLAYESSSSGSYKLSGSGVLSAGTEAVGWYEGQGSFTQSGGTNSASLLAAGFTGSGSYSLSGNGQLTTTNEYVSYTGIGSFTQSGGTNAVSAGLYVGEGGGSNGSYNLSGGSLYAANTYVGYSGTGAFTQSGGTHSATSLYVGYNEFVTATYSLSGNGLLSTTVEYIGYQGNGAFNQSGGTNMTTALALGEVNTTTSSGAYTLSNGLLSAVSESIGVAASVAAATCSFTQSGGNNTVSTALYIGENDAVHGSYTLTGGQLSAPYEVVAESGYGIFTQSGGNNTVTSNSLYVGQSEFSGGTYGLSGNGALSAPAEYLGYQGNGRFTQTGGSSSNEVSGTLTLAYSTGSTGTYNLNGGLLTLGGLSQGNGAASFNFSAGTLQSTSSFATSVPITLNQFGSTAVFNTSGNSLTLNGALSGPGGLQKVGQGTLVLAASNNYTGPTTLTAGVLEVANGNSGSATGSNTVTLNGGVLATGPAGGTITGEVVAGNGPHTIAPGAALSSGYGTLNLGGGLATNNYTKLLFNLNLTSSSGSGTNGLKIYSGDLINFNGGALNVQSGGQIAVVNTPTQTGDYPLFGDATLTGGTASLNDLTLPNQSGVSYGLSTTVEPGYVDLVVSVGNAGTSGGTWTYNGSGSWGTGSNWSGGLLPSSGTVTLGSPSGPVTVTLDGYRTAGALVFNGANGYTLSQGSGGALTLGTTAGGSITVNNGSHIISAPLQMAGNLSIGVASGAALTLSGAVSESATGTSFTFNGPGTLNYSAVGTFTGNTRVNGGTLNLTGGYLPGGANENVLSATVVQSGGSNVVSPAGYYNALYVDSGATYTLSGGQLSANAEWVSYDASAAFVQTGGTNTAANFLNIGAFETATYTLSGGLLSANTEEVGAMGTPYSSTITQSGGTNLATTLYLGYGSFANYYLTGGTSGGAGTAFRTDRVPGLFQPGRRLFLAVGGDQLGLFPLRRVQRRLGRVRPQRQRPALRGL